MDIGLYLGKLINIKTIINTTAERDAEIEKYRKYAEKETITCPICMANLLLRAGDIRDSFCLCPRKNMSTGSSL